MTFFIKYVKLVYALNLKLSIGCSKFLFSHIDKIYLSLFFEYVTGIVPNNSSDIFLICNYYSSPLVLSLKSLHYEISQLLTIMRKNGYHRKTMFQTLMRIFLHCVWLAFLCIYLTIFSLIIFMRNVEITFPSRNAFAQHKKRERKDHDLAEYNAKN